MTSTPSPHRSRSLAALLPAALLSATALLSCTPAAPAPGGGPDPAAVRGADGPPLVIPPLPLPFTVRTPGEKPQEPGLELRLREAGSEALPVPLPTGVTPVETGALPDAATTRLLARLPALPVPAVESFRFPAASPPPPRTGRVVLAEFPPPDTSAPVRPVPVPVREPLRVVRIVPTGDAELAPHVTITFSDAMVPLTTVAGTETRTPPVRLSPQPPGRWSWIDTRTLRFQPEVRLPMATTFTVEIPAGTVSAAGDALPAGVRVQFTTPAPRAIGAYPALHPDSREPPRGPRPGPWMDPSRGHGSSVRLQPVVLVAFDQAVDPAAVLRVTRLTANGQPRQVRLARPDEIAADTVVRRLTDGLEAGRWVALRPAQPLPGDADVRITVGAGAPSVEGPLTTALPQELQFRTFGPLRIVSHGCWREPCPPGQPWSIQLSNPVDPAAWSAELVQVEPALPDMVVQQFGSEIRISGATRPNTRYRVTLSASVRDHFGQQLQAPRSVDFSTGEPSPALALHGAPFVVLDPDGPPRVMMRSHGIRSLRVRVYRVTPAQWPEYGAAVERWQRSQAGELTPPGELVSSTVVEPTGRGLDFSELPVDIAAALTDGLGHAIVVVDPEGTLPFGIERARNRVNAYAWVQSTRIGLAAAVDSEEVLVWASSLRTGAPLGGAAVTMLPTRRGATTAADGTARIPLSAAGDAALMVTAGADVALLPAEPWPNSRQTWQPRTTAAEFRWFTLTDRGLYRPGETVHFKGWIRELPGRRGAELQLADAGGIDFRMTGPRREEIATAVLRPGALGGFDTRVELPAALNLGHAGIELRVTGVDEQRPGNRAWHSVQIQEFRRPEYEVRVEADPGPHIVGGVIDVQLAASYYGGGGLADAQLDWRVTTRRTSYAPPGWQRWRFGRAAGPGGGVSHTHELSAVTDAAGVHRLLIDLLSVDPPFTTGLRVDAQVHDVTRQVGSAGVNLLVHPAALNVGLRSARNWLSRGQPAELEVVVVDHDGRVAAGRTVDVVLERVIGSWWMSDAPVDSASMRTVCTVTSAAEPALCRFTADSSGTHRIRADVRDDAGRRSRSELMIHVAGTPGAPDQRGEPNQIEVVADREEYQPGDSARILVQPPFHPAEALLTVRGAGVLSTQRFRIESPSYELVLPITEAHISGINVRVELVDAVGGLNFAFGETSLTVPPHRRGLDVRIMPRDTLATPGAETLIDVEVRDADGRLAPGAEVALWMVDESVLALGGYALSDPLAAFYARRHGYIQDQHSRRWVLHWPRSAGPGTVSGTVLDGSRGRALAGATIRLAGTDNETTAAFDGSFTLRGVAPGRHVLEAVAPDGTAGRRTIEVPAEGVHVGNMVLGEFGLVMADAIQAMEGEARAAVAVAPLPPAPPPPPAPPGMALDAMVVTGQGGGAADEEISVREDFSPLAFFEPSLIADANGRVQVRVRLPETLTRYRVMAVAVSGAQRFGTGEAAVTARKELMVRVSAPRFLNHGDVFELPVLVQNATSRTLDVELAARASGLEIRGAAGRRLRLGPGARAEVRFDAAALVPGAAHVQAVAVAGGGATAGGEAADAAAAEIPVYTPATAEAFAVYGTLDSGAPAVLPLARPEGVIAGFGGLEVTVTSTALHALTDAVLYLRTYPFEGSEHIASRVLAVAALRDVLSAFGAEGLPDPAALVAGTQRDIADLVARQAGDGGWSFWRGAGPTHPFVSMHVAHALERAREKGFDVPPAALELASRYLRNMEQHTASWPLAARQSAQAYALYVRQRIGDAAAVPEARRLATEPLTRVGGELPVEATAWLLHVLAADPASRPLADTLRSTLVNRLVETAGTATFAERYEDGGHLLLHSRQRTDAVVLEAMIAAGGDEDVVVKLAHTLLAHRVAGRWSGTQENSWVLLALDRYFRAFEATTPAFDSRVWLGDQYAGGHTFAGRTTERHHVSIPMPQLLRTDAEELVIAREGAGRMYYRAGLRYAPADTRLPAADRGFVVSRSYEAVDDDADVTRDADGSWRIRAGARVRVRISMLAPSVRFHVALVDPMPAGFEPLNPVLRGTGFADTPQPATPGTPGMPGTPGIRGGIPGPWRPTWFEHQNLRDDRAEAFTSVLSAGSYEYAYLARATTPGTFVVPPPRAEMMYEPETFGRGAGETVVVEPR